MAEERRQKGSGSLRKRGRADGTVTWQFKTVVDHAIYFRTIKAETKTVAKKMLRAFQAEIETGEVQRKKAKADAIDAHPTLGEWCETYLEKYLKVTEGAFASTRRVYASAYKHLSPELRDCKLGNLTKNAFEDWLRELRVNGRLRNRGTPGVSLETVALVRAAIGSALTKAVKRGLIATNPTPTMGDLNLGSRVTASARAKRSALSHGQVAALLACLDTDPRLRLWIQIMAATTCRPGEASAFTWGDVNFTCGILSVRHSVKDGTVRGQGRLGAPKNESSVRDIPIGKTLQAAFLESRKAHEHLLRQIAGVSDGIELMRPLVEPDMCIFYAGLASKSEREAPRPVAYWRGRFKKVLVRAGLPASTKPHALRHTAITAMIAGDKDRPGVSVVDAAKLAGHSSPSITLNVYAHAVQANLNRGAELADALIAPTPVAEVESITRTK